MYEQERKMMGNTFKATKREPRKIHIDFASGKKVSFTATKRVPRKIGVDFSIPERKDHRFTQEHGSS